MNPHLMQAINDLQSMKRTDEITGCHKCYKKLQCESELHNESISRSISSTFKSSNALMVLSVNSGCVAFNRAFSAQVLKSLIKILLDSAIESEDKEKAINLLTKHAVLHPACRVSLSDTYHNLILEPMEDLENQTIIQKIITDLENIFLQDASIVLNPRQSRNLRHKKKSDDFFTEEDYAIKRSRKNSTNGDPVDGSEVTENNPMFRFAALKFIVEIMCHEFYAKCSGNEDMNVFKNTIAGKIFLKFNELEVKLEDEFVNRCIEMYKYCDESNRKPFEEIIELIANTCLFADTGKLSVHGDIMNNKQYSLSQLFCQYFIQSLFKRPSLSESIAILKKLKPQWLRLICAHEVLKRTSGNSKGFSYVLEKLSTELEKCLNDNDASSAVSDSKSSSESKFQIDEKMYDSIFEKKLNEEIAIVLMNIIQGATATYHLRELQRLYEINLKKNITADTCTGNYEVLVHEFESYVQYKNVINRIVDKIENTPSYVKALKFL